MPGPYLIGVDGGTQSTKVVVSTPEGNAVAEGRQALRPIEPAAATASSSIPTTTSGTRSPLRAARRLRASTATRARSSAVGLCTIRCCKAFLRRTVRSSSR